MFAINRDKQYHPALLLGGWEKGGGPDPLYSMQMCLQEMCKDTTLVASEPLKSTWSAALRLYQPGSFERDTSAQTPHMMPRHLLSGVRLELSRF